MLASLTRLTFDADIVIALGVRRSPPARLVRLASERQAPTRAPCCSTTETTLIRLMKSEVMTCAGAPRHAVNFPRLSRTRGSMTFETLRRHLEDGFRRRLRTDRTTVMSARRCRMIATTFSPEVVG